MINCLSKEIIITSGVNESNKLADKGIINYYFHNAPNPEKISVISSTIDHPSVIEIFPYLKSIYKDNLKLILIPCNSIGIIDIETFKAKKYKISFFNVS